jgi:hypothetical protein
MANEIVHYPGSSWPDVVAAAEGYKNGIPESRLSQEVQVKLNADKKPVGGWTEADFSTSVQKLLHLAGGFADNDESASTGTRNVNIDGYMLTAGALVSVRFANAVPAGASLRISPDGGSTYTTRKNIWYDGAPLPADTIKAGMTVSFRYDGSYYQVVAMIPAVAEITVDPTLTQPGEAADAAAVGVVKGRLEAFGMAVIDAFKKIGWLDTDGEETLAELEDILFPAQEVASISAVFEQGQTVVYDSDSLDSLKPMLTVTATYSDATTGVVTAYTLSGTLTAGTSTITVSYRGKTTTFSVTVTHKPSLDDIAYGTLTYRDIFVTNNLLKYLGDFEDSSITLRSDYVRPSTNVAYKIAYGSPSVTTEEANTGTHSLKASTTSGSTSQNVVINNGNAPANSTILFAFSTKITRYVAGMTFLQYGSPYTASAIETLPVEHVTNGWEEVVSLHTIPSNELWVYVGSRLNPNLDGYVDDIVATPVPSTMTQAEAEDLYSTYLEIRRSGAE